MPYPFYDDREDFAAEAVDDLPQPWDSFISAEEEETDLKRYKPDDGLQSAVNAALLLGQPLLLTGEPGTGKTKLAYHLAAKLGWGKPLKFETKSTSNARDLFYLYDALGHFRQVQRLAHSGKSESVSALDYITLNPLGIAILLSLPEDKLTNGLDKLLQKHLSREEWDSFEPRRSVVLIDEIDKAPRDFPNDILNEIETLYFRIPELAEESGLQAIAADTGKRPVVVITSNSEKHLPEPFLRRCVYYNIPFPDKERMRMIIKGYTDDLPKDSRHFLDDALSLFYALRDERLRKKPSTAELPAWLRVLREAFKAELGQSPPFGGAERPLASKDNADRLAKTLNTLIKVQGDQDTELPRILEKWRGRTK